MTLRIGVLGAARITKSALLGPASDVADVSVTALAARDPARAKQYAKKHGIPTVFGSYGELLASPDIDVVYIPLPAALHGKWTIAAIEAGKHVLVEKPFAANADEAQRVADAAAASDLVVMEAFHSMYHPIVTQLRGILDSGELGTLEQATAAFCVPIPPGKDIRWNLALAGGGLMDVGCYPVRMLQALFGYDAAVTSATSVERGGVDETMRATLAMPRIPQAHVVSSMWSKQLLSSRLEIIGSAGRLTVKWPYQPQIGVRIKLHTASGRSSQAVSRTSTYVLQLEAFRDAIALGTPLASPLAESVAMMKLIDAIYLEAGMQPRQPLA